MGKNNNARDAPGRDFRCPYCGGRNLVFRKRLPHFWCRRCGTTFNYHAPKNRYFEVRYQGKHAPEVQGEKL